MLTLHIMHNNTHTDHTLAAYTIYLHTVDLTTMDLQYTSATHTHCPSSPMCTQALATKDPTYNTHRMAVTSQQQVQLYSIYTHHSKHILTQAHP
jgi:hypothetical protein